MGHIYNIKALFQTKAEKMKIKAMWFFSLFIGSRQESKFKMIESAVDRVDVNREDYFKPWNQSI